MEFVSSSIELSNPIPDQEITITAICLVDSGYTHLCIPAHMAHQLQLKEIDHRKVRLADGSLRSVPYAGPVKISFENRTCFVGAMIMGDQCLLGAIPMEDMDLVIHPKLFKLSVNPSSPNIARGRA